MRKTCTVFLLLAVSSAAWAAGWIGAYEVANIEVSDTTIYFGKPDNISGFPNPDGCGNSNFVAIDGATPLAARALAVVLAAQASGRKVRYYTNGCLGGYIRAYAVSTDPSW